MVSVRAAAFLVVPPTLSSSPWPFPVVVSVLRGAPHLTPSRLPVMSPHLLCCAFSQRASRALCWVSLFTFSPLFSILVQDSSPITSRFARRCKSGPSISFVMFYTNFTDTLPVGGVSAALLIPSSCLPRSIHSTETNVSH